MFLLGSGFSLVTRIWLITGDPCVGKTTCLSRIIKLIQTEGFTVGGVISREIRKNKQRTGFEMMDIQSGRNGIMASSDQKCGPKFGRYRVNLQNIVDIGVNALLSSVKIMDLTICDEIGPMELFSPEFRRAVASVMKSGRPILSVVHKHLEDPLVVTLKSEENAKLFEVTLENRDGLPASIASEVLNYLRIHS